MLQRDESFAQARYDLALALLDLRKRDEAIVELERVVRAGPKVADPNLALGTVYLDAGRVDEAIQVLRQGTTIDPSRVDMRIVLARGLRTKGLLDQADAELVLAKPKAAASGTPQFSQQQPEPDFYMELGLLRRQQGRLQAAAQAFQKVLELQPDREDAARQLSEVRHLLPASGRKPAPGTRRDHDQVAGFRSSSSASCFDCFTVAATRRSHTRAAIQLVDVTAKSNISFVHQSGASPDKRMVETFGSGVAWIDYDNDGFVDLYFVNGAPGAANALYRNNKGTARSPMSPRGGHGR